MKLEKNRWKSIEHKLSMHVDVRGLYAVTESFESSLALYKALMLYLYTLE